MADDLFASFFDYCRTSFQKGLNAPVGHSVKSRPSFWNPFNTWRDEDERQLRELYDRAKAAFDQSIFRDEEALEKAVATISARLCDETGLEPYAPIMGEVIDATYDLLREEFFTFPEMTEVGWDNLDLTQANKLREDLEQRLSFLGDWQSLFNMAMKTCTQIWLHIIAAFPQSAASSDAAASPGLPAEMVSQINDAHEVMTTTLAMFLSNDQVLDNHLFVSQCRQLYRNLLEATGIAVDPDKALPDHDKINVIFPNDCLKENPSEVAQRYFQFTPFDRFFAASIPFHLPQSARFEHCHILGGTGHGKTQCLQYLVHEDLIRAVEDETQSLVVIDSQGSLIKNILSSALFDPDVDVSLSDRLILIDPADIERPPAINLFNPGIERFEDYSPQQREIAFNSLVDIYGRFFGALLGAELTARQGSVFRYLARLMLTIDGATIHTLIELMDDVRPFASHIEKLDPTARRFFEKEFSRKGFNGTRRQIKDRLYAVLSIPTFDRLFSAPKTKVNFFDALNSGKIILIDTAKSLLKDEGTAIFGRFMLALIEHAVTERANILENKRNPVLLYMDEAHEYFDDTVETLLIEARKYKCGLTLAHQNLSQLSPKLRAVFMGNTTIKLAGGITDQDARALSSDMRTTRDFLLKMKKHEQDGTTEFALSVRNVTPRALKITIPLGLMESHPVLKPQQRHALLEANRERVGYDPQTETSPEIAPSPETEIPREELPQPSEVDRAREEVLATKEDEAPATAPQPGHVAAQRDLAEAARARGFGVEIEHALPNGKRVDLALFGQGSRIAIEISVTNRKDYELSNIEKALDAGFDHIWMIADNPKHRETIASHVRQSLSHDQLSRVTFGTTEDALAWLGRFQVPQGDQTTVAGYEVKTEIVPPSSLSDHRHRIEQLRYIISC